MYSAAVSTSSSTVSTETPSQRVPSFDHLVTQWMSVVISSEGSSLNSSHTHLIGSSTSPTMEKSHSSSGVRGVGPAESTGNPSTRYCPGGRWVSCTCFLRRPRKPREKNPSLMSYTSWLFRLYSTAPLVRAARLYDDASRFFSERWPEGQRCKPDPRLASSRLDRYANRQGKRSSLMPALPTPSPRPPTRRRIQIRRYEGEPRPQPRRRGGSANGSAGRRSYARGCRAGVACQRRQALPAPATRTGSPHRRRSLEPLGTRARAHHRTASEGSWQRGSGPRGARRSAPRPAGSCVLRCRRLRRPPRSRLRAS